MNQLVSFHSADALPVLIAAAGESAKIRFVEFFTANIRNRNTRRAYARAVSETTDRARIPPARRRAHGHPH
jgi:hypothetical protein